MVFGEQDDTYEDSSLFSVGSVGSAVTNGGAGGRLPSSPSTLGANDQSDDDEEDDELRGRWGNDGVVVGGGEKYDATKAPRVSVVFCCIWRRCCCVAAAAVAPVHDCTRYTLALRRLWR